MTLRPHAPPPPRSKPGHPLYTDPTQEGQAEETNRHGVMHGVMYKVKAALLYIAAAIAAAIEYVLNLFF